MYRYDRDWYGQEDDGVAEEGANKFLVDDERTARMEVSLI